jgi:IstB-like ATP binding protein
VSAEQHSLFTDFLETLLSAERESRRVRAREMFARVAGFPVIKTLDQYDFGFATLVAQRTARTRHRTGRPEHVIPIKWDNIVLYGLIHPGSEARPLAPPCHEGKRLECKITRICLVP